MTNSRTDLRITDHAPNIQSKRYSRIGIGIKSKPKPHSPSTSNDTTELESGALRADRVVNHVVVEEALGAVTPGESLSADVVVLVESALRGVLAILVVLVHHVVVVVLLDAVDVDGENDGAGDADVERNLAPQVGRLYNAAIEVGSERGKDLTGVSVLLSGFAL